MKKGVLTAVLGLFLCVVAIYFLNYYTEWQREKSYVEYMNAQIQLQQDDMDRRAEGHLLSIGVDWPTVQNMRKDREENKRHREIMDSLNHK